MGLQIVAKRDFHGDRGAALDRSAIQRPCGDESDGVTRLSRQGRCYREKQNSCEVKAVSHGKPFCKNILTNQRPL